MTLAESTSGDRGRSRHRGRRWSRKLSRHTPRNPNDSNLTAALRVDRLQLDYGASGETDPNCAVTCSL